MAAAGGILVAPVRWARVALAWHALAFGLAFAALTLRLDYATGRGAYWDAQLGDAAKGEIGWFYYARDDWRFPLFDTDAYHDPEGSSIVLADGLPLFALPAKLIYRATASANERPFVYTGAWVALCLVLQAVFASRLLRTLNVTAPLAHLAGIAIFCYLPIVMLRFGQAALMAQFTILLALERYVRAKREGLGSRAWAMLCALPALVLLVHPYLAAMCGVLVAATIFDQWRDARIGARGVAVRLAGIAASALTVLYAGGFFEASADFGDYGLYSLNLLSPWIPFPQTAAGRLLGTEMPVITGTNQWEGGAYLGAGVLLLCAVASPALRDWRANLRRHAVLLASLVAVLAFAISHRVGFGATELATLPIPDALLHLCSQFRGSGRFVWLPVYALVAALIAAVVHRYPRRASALLALAAALEIADVLPMQSGVRAASGQAAPSTIDRAAWTRLVGAHERLFEFPSFECGGVFGNGVPGTKFRELEIDWIAAEAMKPTNSAYLARFTKDCARERERAAVEHGRPGTLYLYRSTAEIGEFLASRGIDLSRCGYLDDVVVCSASVDLSALR